MALVVVFISMSSSDGECDVYADTSLLAGAVALPQFGLEVTDVTPRMARQADLDQVKGCFVQMIAGGSPAEDAGLQLGDIIVSLNNRGIRNAKELQNDVAGLEPGEVAKMCVVRDDYRTTIYIAPIEAPSPKSRETESHSWLGVEITDVASGSMESFKLEEAGKEGGIFVENVIAGSPADKAGIQPGDVIMSFNSRKVRTAKELATDLAGAAVGEEVRLCIMREDIRKTIYLVLENSPRSSYQLASHESSTSEQGWGTLSEAQLATVFPQASRFERREQPIPYFRAYGSSDEFIGVAFVTTEVCPKESEGYQGPISTLVGVSTEGKIVGVHLLYHTESSKYVLDQLEQFIKQYENKDATDPFILGRDVDAISGATITSSAINQSIEVGSAIVLAAVLNIEHRGASKGFGKFSWDQIIWQIDSILIFLAIAVFALVGYFRCSQTMRFFVLGLSFLYFGFIKGGGFSVYDVINVLQGDFPLFETTLYWYALVSFIALTSLLIGRFYCGWICPFGGLTEILYRAFPRFKVSVSFHVDKWLRLLKYLILLVILFAVFFIGQWHIMISMINIIEPFGTAFTLSGDLIMWLLLAFFLVCSVFISRFYCKYVCPLGAFFALITIAVSFAKNMIFKTTPSARHKNPNLLAGGCPMDAIRYDKDYTDMNIQNGECIVCFRAHRHHQSPSVPVSSSRDCVARSTLV